MRCRAGPETPRTLVLPCPIAVLMVPSAPDANFRQRSRRWLGDGPNRRPSAFGPHVDPRWQRSARTFGGVAGRCGWRVFAAVVVIVGVNCP